jgi:hypothetical protein
MSRKVRLKFSFQGNIAPGIPWPGFNEVLNADEAFAARLVAGEWAVYLDDEPEAVDVTGFAPLRKFSENYDPVLDPENRKKQEPDDDLPDYEDEVDPEDGPVKRPYTNAAKGDWVEYAVSKGEDPDVASRMTKVDLISKYGASL